MLDDLRSILFRLRDGRRDPYNYRHLRVLDDQITKLAQSSKIVMKNNNLTRAETERLVEDLINVAAARAIKNHPYFEKIDLWDRLTRGIRVNLRYDIYQKLYVKICKKQKETVDFLIASELAGMCSECHLNGKGSGNVERFWEKIGAEMNELSNKKFD
jgi:hypothetical protein